jgi:L-tartrate/succinate antiporter
LRPLVWKALAPVLVAGAIAFCPVPAGLQPNAWLYFALFTGVIAGLILEPVPAAAVGVIGVTAIAVLAPYALFDARQLADPAFKEPAEAVAWALAGFSNDTVWLIFGAFMFALGYEKTGLGKRIGLLLVRSLGGRTLGLGYAIMVSDLILAPFTPSNTARSGGTIFPIIRNIPALYDSRPGPTSRRIGAYVMWTAFSTTCITSSMFLTALAPNLLAVELVRKTIKVDISWTQWLVGFLPVGLPLLLLLPLLVFVIYPPEIRRSPEVPKWAAAELATMGPLSRHEVVMAALVVLALMLWIFAGGVIGATIVALVVISLMVMTGVVTWDDVLTDRPAWNVLVWFATLVTLASGLNKVGFITWFAKTAAAMLVGLSPIAVMVVLVILFFVVHYMFASSTAHTTAVLPVVLAAGAAVPGLPATVLALLLVFSLGLMGVITPYATGPAPVYFGSGYVSRKDFWTLGLIFGTIFLAALLIIGVPTLLALNPVTIL